MVTVESGDCDKVLEDGSASMDNKTEVFETVDILGNGLVEKKVCYFLLRELVCFSVFTQL